MQHPRINPLLVRFSQSSINRRFKTGETLDEIAEALRTGDVDPDAFPPIRLLERGGHLFTLDNRRLEAFRRAGIAVPYRMATLNEAAAEDWTFTTTNEGTTVRVRGEP